MSVTFQPALDLEALRAKNPDPKDFTWTGSFFSHNWGGMPSHVKATISSLTEASRADIDQWCWAQGQKPIDFWERIISQMRIPLVNRWPWCREYIAEDDEGKNYGFVLYGEQPEHVGMQMNLANGNAHALCTMLGIPERGRMNPIALLRKVEAVQNRGDDHLSEFTENPSDSDPFELGGGGARMIGMGRNLEQMQSYLLSLETLCDHCIRYECDVQWG